MKPIHTSLAVLTVICALPATAQQSAARLDAPLVVVGDQHRFERVCDVDGDGSPDVVGFWWQDNYQDWAHLKAYVNDGAGKVAATWVEYQLNQFTGAEIAYEVATGDLSGDGRDDVVFALSQSVVAWRSNGATAAPTEWYTFAIPAGEGARSVAIADFDADGKLDFVLATDKLRIFKNNGPAAPFAPSAALAVGLPTEDLTTGDVTGDGRPDVILQQAGTVRVFPFDAASGAWGGEADFSHQITGVAGTVWGDIDGDGDGDITVFGMSGSFQVIRQIGRGSWVVEPVQAGGPATDLDDVDGDGDLDGTCCGGGSSSPLHNVEPSRFEIAHNTGLGEFDAAFAIPSLGAEHLAGVADMDQDGDADLVAGRVIYYADGPILRSPFVAGTGSAIAPSALADVDLDGDPDLEVGSGSVHCNLGDGSLEARVPAVPAAPAGTSFVGSGFPGDWDGDGDTDLVVRHLQGATLLGMRMLENTGGGGYVDGGAASPAGWDFNVDADELDDPARSAAFDADGDGDLDLVTHKVEGPAPYPAEYELQSTIWFNDGTGWFGSRTDIGPEEALVGAGDLNGDGLTDLVVITDPDWKIGARFGIGFGAFGPKVNLPQGAPLGAVVEPTDPVVVADLDQDGDVDVAAPSSSGYVYTFANGGFGLFAQHLVGGPDLLGYGNLSLVAADVDGDGWKDLVVGGLDDAPNAFAVLLKKHNALGTSSYQPAVKQVGDFDTLEDLRAAVDLDGDGDVDLVGEDLMVMGRSYSGSGIGARLQLGASSAGTAGMAPTLGAAGPFRLGESPKVIVSGALGGTLGLLGVGFEQVAIPAFPFPDATLYLDPFDPALVLAPFGTSGPPGVPGAGRLEIQVTVHPDMVGVTFNHQTFTFDPGNPSLITASNGLLLTYGQ